MNDETWRLVTVLPTHTISTHIERRTPIRKNCKRQPCFEARTATFSFESYTVDMMLYSKLLGNKAMHAYNGNMKSSPKRAKEKRKSRRGTPRKRTRVAPDDQDVEIKDPLLKQKRYDLNKDNSASRISLSDREITHRDDGWMNDDVREKALSPTNDELDKSVARLSPANSKQYDETTCSH